MSDTRTNAGVDNFSKTRKMFTWEVPGERVLTIMTAGNLATTQAVISLIEERSKPSDDRMTTILQEHSMFQVASLVGDTLKEVVGKAVPIGPKGESNFAATLIVGGQIKGGPPTLFMIYPEGNFIEITEDTPYFQIGEAKYGKPILVRAYDPDMSFAEAAKLMMVSFDSTIKANLSVGMPLDMVTYQADSFKIRSKIRFEDDDPRYLAISHRWGDALRSAFHSLPTPEL